MFHNRIIEDGKSLTLTSTDKIELPEQGDLSGLVIRFGGTTASNLKRTTGGDWRVIEYISDIVLKVNGTSELCHLSGENLTAFQFYDLGIMPFDKNHNYSTASIDVWLMLLFGRYPGDEEVGVPLQEYSNPELWITNTATSSEFSAISLDLVGYMRWKGGQGFPMGYLNKKDYKSWTGVRGETEKTKLPTTHKCRRILLHSEPEKDSSYISKTNMFNPMENVKLTFRGGQDIFYDGHSEILARIGHFQKMAYCETALAAGFNADVGFTCGIGYVNGRSAVSGPRDGAAAATHVSLEGNRTDNTQKLEGGGDDEMPEMLFRGICPENHLAFLFDDKPSPQTWLDLAQESQVELEIKTRDHADADDGTNRILLERLLPHGQGA